jgi:hypothetical protein
MSPNIKQSSDWDKSLLTPREHKNMSNETTVAIATFSPTLTGGGVPLMQRAEWTGSSAVRHGAAWGRGQWGKGAVLTLNYENRSSRSQRSQLTEIKCSRRLGSSLWHCYLLAAETFRGSVLALGNVRLIQTSRSWTWKRLVSGNEYIMLTCEIIPCSGLQSCLSVLAPSCSVANNAKDSFVPLPSTFDISRYNWLVRTFEWHYYIPERVRAIRMV